MQRPLSLAFCGLLLGACGDDSNNGNDNTNQNNAACAEGLESHGLVCIPVFDDCPGSTEIPVLGGGCLSVGVSTCATGLFAPDGEGGCEPILPPGPGPCAPGTMEVLGQTECQPVGVTACATGFESDSAGGCDAVLPPGHCPSGTIALLGHPTCQPLGDCGTGTWGTIVDDPTTVYVDQTADASGADGTAQAPYVTIEDALTEVLPGGQIAIAAGDYLERLVIEKPVRLTGRCAELVTLRGKLWSGNYWAPVGIGAGGSGTTISGVTLTGPAAGLSLHYATQIVLSQVQVRDASDVGIVALGEAEATLWRVVVAGCAYMGIVSIGSTLDVQESVVRDTLPELGTGDFGWGIYGYCSSGGVCGSLRISSSVVSDNRQMGIDVQGVNTEVIGSVVRNTQPEESTGTLGRGIHAQCGYVDCGSLLVSASLVSGNRDAGITGQGVDTEIIGTVVRDTLPEESSGRFGRGINGMDSDNQATGSLRVSDSLISGNHGTGIFASDLDAEITSTWVRGRQSPQPVDTGGAGIAAECYSPGACGSLLVSDSLIQDNRSAGISTLGVDTEVVGTVVASTQTDDSTDPFALGIAAACFPDEGSCGSLRVSSSIVTDNAHIGINTIGVDAEVVATVIRGAPPGVGTGEVGRGLNAQCYSAGYCGTLQVSLSLISGHRGTGVNSSGVDTEIRETTVRDNLPLESNGDYGLGIYAGCGPAGSCGRLRVSSSLVSNNREVSILLRGVPSEISATVIRDTLPSEINGKFGRAIEAQCSTSAGSCGNLWVSNSLIENSENLGLFISGMPTTLEGVSVIDTSPNTWGEWQGTLGQGIWAVCDRDTGNCGGLWMTACLVDSCQNAGVALEGVSGFLASSLVRSVVPQAQDDKYGYGIQVSGLPGQALPVFNVTDSEIRDTSLAGILFGSARGFLGGLVVSGGENSVVMNEGAVLTIRDDNVLSGSVNDEPIWANLFPSPAPSPALPLE